MERPTRSAIARIDSAATLVVLYAGTREPYGAWLQQEADKDLRPWD